MKFSTLFSGVVASIALAASASMAAPAAGVTIATVNIQEIMHDSTAAQSIKEQLDTKQKSFQAEMTKKEAQFNADEQELRKQRSVLAPEAFEKKFKAFKAKETAAQKEVQSKRAELDNAFSSSLAEIQKAVFDIVGAMAKEKGYIAVMPASQILWSDPSLDITKDVLAKLNTTLPKVAVTFKPVAEDDAASKAE